MVKQPVQVPSERGDVTAVHRLTYLENAVNAVLERAVLRGYQESPDVRCTREAMSVHGPAPKLSH
jgi:hypothetical protein